MTHQSLVCNKLRTPGNILVHGYFDIDTDIVWDAATRDVLAIKPAVERLLEILKEQRR